MSDKAQQLDTIANSQFDAGECREYLKNILPLFQSHTSKQAIAALIGTDQDTNCFTFNQLLVLSFAVLVKTFADDFDEAWAILEKYLENKKD